MMNIEGATARQNIHSIHPAAREAVEKTTDRDKENEEKRIPDTDKYIHMEEAGKDGNAGIYRLAQDENVDTKVEFKAPDNDLEDALKADPGHKAADSSDAIPDDGIKNASGDNPDNKVVEPQREEKRKTSESTVNTDQVDREIKSLKEELKKIQQQLKQFSGDPEKEKALEHQLSQITQELSAKDNDSYRKQHASCTTEMV